jgi:hypothetical protein
MPRPHPWCICNRCIKITFAGFAPLEGGDCRCICWDDPVYGWIERTGLGDTHYHAAGLMVWSPWRSWDDSPIGHLTNRLDCEAATWVVDIEFADGRWTLRVSLSGASPFPPSIVHELYYWTADLGEDRPTCAVIAAATFTAHTTEYSECDISGVTVKVECIDAPCHATDPERCPTELPLRCTECDECETPAELAVHIEGVASNGGCGCDALNDDYVLAYVGTLGQECAWQYTFPEPLACGITALVLHRSYGFVELLVKGSPGYEGNALKFDNATHQPWDIPPVNCADSFTLHGYDYTANSDCDGSNATATYEAVA